jgi:hypothetical protein
MHFSSFPSSIRTKTVKLCQMLLNSPFSLLRRLPLDMRSIFRKRPKQKLNTFVSCTIHSLTSFIRVMNWCMVRAAERMFKRIRVYTWSLVELFRKPRIDDRLQNNWKLVVIAWQTMG